MKQTKPATWRDVPITAGMLSDVLGKVVCSPTVYKMLEEMAREKLSEKKG